MALSPRQFYEKIHPEKFSDSVTVTKGKLTRSLLEYHLSTITNRNQERSFETFAIKLAQYEICPNLRLQTGPVGGGDSKVDSETIPVAEFTALNYWEGAANENDDRWAVAVSAKKEWVSKVKADVKSAVSTGRPYKKYSLSAASLHLTKKGLRPKTNYPPCMEYRLSFWIATGYWTGCSKTTVSNSLSRNWHSMKAWKMKFPSAFQISSE